MKVFLDFYMKEKNSHNSYELFNSDKIKINTSDDIDIKNIDSARMLVIDYLSSMGVIDLEEYKIQVYEKGDMKIINTYFEYDKSLDRELKLTKILDGK